MEDEVASRCTLGAPAICVCVCMFPLCNNIKVETLFLTWECKSWSRDIREKKKGIGKKKDGGRMDPTLLFLTLLIPFWGPFLQILAEKFGK